MSDAPLEACLWAIDVRLFRRQWRRSPSWGSNATDWRGTRLDGTTPLEGRNNGRLRESHTTDWCGTRRNWAAPWKARRPT